MTDLDTAVRRVLHDLADTSTNTIGVSPNVGDVQRRIREQRNRRIGGIVATVMMAALGAMVVAAARNVGGSVKVVLATSTTVAPTTTPPVSTSPVTTSPVTTLPSAAPGFSVVLARGDSLVEVDRSGEVTRLAPLPGPGDDSPIYPLVSGRGNHVLVAYALGTLFSYERGKWDSPTELGNHGSNGYALTERGFWAQDPRTVDSEGSRLAWREFDWSGAPLGPKVQPNFDGEFLPVGAIPGGVALWEMGTGQVVLATPTNVQVVGRGAPFAAGPAGVAFRSDGGELLLADITTGAVRVVAALGEQAPAESIYSGSFSPDGAQVAVVTTLASAQGNAASVLSVFDLASGTERRLPVDATAARVAWTPDGSALLVHVASGLVIIDPTTGASKVLVTGRVLGFGVLGP
jgi:hypothetical protein